MHTDTGELEAVLNHDDDTIMVYFPVAGIRPWGNEAGLYAVGVGANNRLVVYCPYTRTMRDDHRLPPDDINVVWAAAAKYIVKLEAHSG